MRSPRHRCPPRCEGYAGGSRVRHVRPEIRRPPPPRADVVAPSTRPPSAPFHHRRLRARGPVDAPPFTLVGGIYIWPPPCSLRRADAPADVIALRRRPTHDAFRRPSLGSQLAASPDALAYAACPSRAGGPQASWYLNFEERSPRTSCDTLALLSASSKRPRIDLPVDALGPRLALDAKSARGAARYASSTSHRPHAPSPRVSDPSKSARLLGDSSPNAAAALGGLIALPASLVRLHFALLLSFRFKRAPRA